MNTKIGSRFSTIFLAAWLFLPCLTVAVAAQTALLFSWDPNVETNIIGYRLLSGTASRTYTVTNTILGRTIGVGYVSNVPPGRVFFTVVAYDTTGIDSDYSTEITWTNRASAPKNFRLAGVMQASLSPSGPWKDLAQMDATVPVLADARRYYYRTVVRLEEFE